MITSSTTQKSIQEVADWAGCEFGELRGFRLVAENIRILLHTEGFAVFLPENVWGKFHYQVSVSFPKKEDSTCWIAEKTFAYAKVELPPPEGSKEDNIEITLDRIESLVHKHFLETPLTCIDPATIRAHLEHHTRSMSLKRKLSIYKIHAYHLLMDLTNLLHIPATKAPTKETVLSNEGFYRYKKGNISILSDAQVTPLQPWLDHLRNVVSQINHELEIKELDFTKPIPVTTSDGREINPRVEYSGYYSLYESYVHQIKMFIGDITIGKVEFKFVKERNAVFVCHLQNYSIKVSGKREYSRVGTGLLNVLKDVCSILDYPKILLTAQTPYWASVPDNHDLLSFYGKNDFERSDNKGDDDYGYRMVWYKK